MVYVQNGTMITRKQTLQPKIISQTLWGRYKAHLNFEFFTPNASETFHHGPQLQITVVVLLWLHLLCSILRCPTELRVTRCIPLWKKNFRRVKANCSCHRRQAAGAEHLVYKLQSDDHIFRKEIRQVAAWCFGLIRSRDSSTRPFS